MAMSFFLPPHNFSFPLLPPPGFKSLSFKKEVQLMMTGQGAKQDFQNTDFASLKALLHVGHTAQRQSFRQPDGAMTLTKQKKGKQKQNHPNSVFSQTKGETEGWYSLQLGDDGRGPPRQSQIVSTC